MKTYILVHEHRYGVTTVPFRSEAPIGTLEDNIEKLCNILCIDFEPEADEVLSLSEMNIDELQIVAV